MNGLSARIEDVIVHHDAPHTPLEIWIPLHIIGVKIAYDGNPCGIVVNQGALGVFPLSLRVFSVKVQERKEADHDERNQGKSYEYDRA